MEELAILVVLCPVLAWCCRCGTHVIATPMTLITSGSMHDVEVTDMASTRPVPLWSAWAPTARQAGTI